MLFQQLFHFMAVVFVCLVQDKKPVGILCLPEYQSCHKADSKECKKSNSFVLGKGSVSAADNVYGNY